MKKCLMIGVTALMMTTAQCLAAGTDGSVVAVNAEEESSNGMKYTTYKFNCKNFNKLDLGFTVQAHLVRSNSYKIEVTLPTELKEYLDVTVKDGKLRIGMNNNFTDKIQRKYQNWTFKAEIAMPELRKLEMSGVSELTCDDAFILEGREFTLNVSGASSLKSLNVSGDLLKIEMSGAPHYKFNGSFDRALVNMSGAAEGQLRINADNLNLNADGACKTKLGGDFGTADLKITGAAGLNIEGNVRREMKVKTSGAANVWALNAMARDVIVEASGASNCELQVKRSLIIRKASGAATIKYKKTNDTGVALDYIGRGASVEKID